MEEPHMVRYMAITGFPPMADERRGLLTTREREIISGDADVNDEYYYSVVSRVRRKIDNLAQDAVLLQEHHPELGEELREAVSGDDSEEGDNRLNAMMNLLDTHEDKWREASKEDARYEVDMPDGTTQYVQTKDDVRAHLFKNY